jgi:IclR helix-turn-helix domain.
MGPDPGDQNRNDDGQFTDSIPPESVLNVFDDRDDQARPLTATDIADKLGFSRQTAHRKLHLLVEREVLDTRKVGARARVWWIPDTGASVADRQVRGSAETTLDEDSPVERIPTDELTEDDGEEELGVE